MYTWSNLLLVQLSIAFILQCPSLLVPFVFELISQLSVSLLVQLVMACIPQWSLLGMFYFDINQSCCCTHGIYFDINQSCCCTHGIYFDINQSCCCIPGIYFDINQSCCCIPRIYFDINQSCCCIPRIYFDINQSCCWGAPPCEFSCCLFYWKLSHRFYTGMVFHLCESSCAFPVRSC